MKYLFTTACIAGSALAQSYNKHWGLFYGGGSGYVESYPYQSDVAAAYLACKTQAMQDDEMVYMAYDDIAHNDLNPLQGEMFNWPTANNAYNSVQLDYTGANVTKEKFLAALKGDAATAGGPVIGSDEDSTVFIFISAPSSNKYQIDFPTGDPLLLNELNAAI